jgi:hypothetical protein
MVSDVIMLGTPNHGAAFPDAICTGPDVCAASLYQMESDSVFLAALNAGHETVGAVPFTAIVTTDDHVFVLPEQGVVDGNQTHVTNVVVQDVCPGHVVDHLGLAFDGPTYALAVDALDHEGPAEASRIDPAVCETDTMPGVDRAYADARVLAYSTARRGAARTGRAEGGGRAAARVLRDPRLSAGTLITHRECAQPERNHAQRPKRPRSTCIPRSGATFAAGRDASCTASSSVVASPAITGTTVRRTTVRRSTGRTPAQRSRSVHPSINAAPVLMA